MATGDWIKLHRKLLESAVFNDEWLLRLWIWCLLRAGYCDRTVAGTTIHAGSFVTGRFAASDELNVSPSRWYRGIHQLASLGMISLSASQERTTITICKWDTYQSDSDVREQQVNSQRTASEQRSDNERTPSEQQADTRKEGKEEEEFEEGKESGEVSPEPPPRARKPRRISSTAADILNGLAIPPELNTQEGIDATRQWLEHKDRIRNQYASKESFGIELSRWAKLGAARFVAAVVYSIGKEWKGIYEESDNGKPKQQQQLTVRGVKHGDAPVADSL